MKILLITQDYPSDQEPVRGIFIHHQAAALQRRGHQVVVLHYVRRAPPWRLKRRLQARSGVFEGIRVYRVEYYWPARSLFDWGWSNAIAQQLRYLIENFPKNEPMVMYAQWLLPTSAACVRLKKSLDIPVVGIARGYDLSMLARRSTFLRHELDLVYHNADLILGNGEWASRALQDLGYDLMERRIELVRNVRDLAIFTEHPQVVRENEPLNIITVAALEERKGIDLLLRSISMLQELDLYLDIVGDGSERSRLEDMVYNLNLQNKVRFRGKLLQIDVAKLLSTSHVFVLPSRREGAPNALIEAMASSVACVASAVGGNPDLIEDQISGLLVPSSNPRALADALHMLFFDEQKRQLLGLNARERMNNLYSYEANLTRLEQALTSVVSKYHG